MMIRAMGLLIVALPAAGCIFTSGGSPDGADAASLDAEGVSVDVGPPGDAGTSADGVTSSGRLQLTSVAEYPLDTVRDFEVVFGMDGPQLAVGVGEEIQFPQSDLEAQALTYPVDEFAAGSVDGRVVVSAITDELVLMRLGWADSDSLGAATFSARWGGLAFAGDGQQFGDPPGRAQHVQVRYEHVPMAAMEPPLGWVAYRAGSGSQNDQLYVEPGSDAPVFFAENDSAETVAGDGRYVLFRGLQAAPDGDNHWFVWDAVQPEVDRTAGATDEPETPVPLGRGQSSEHPCLARVGADRWVVGLSPASDGSPGVELVQRAGSGLVDTTGELLVEAGSEAVDIDCTGTPDGTLYLVRSTGAEVELFVVAAAADDTMSIIDRRTLRAAQSGSSFGEVRIRAQDGQVAVAWIQRIRDRDECVLGVGPHPLP